MYSVTTVEPLIKNLPPFKGHFLWSQMLVFAYLQSGAHKRKERSAPIARVVISKRKLRRALRVKKTSLVMDVYLHAATSQQAAFTS